MAEVDISVYAHQFSLCSGTGFVVIHLHSLSLLSACHLKKKWRKGNAKNITVTLALLFLEVKFLFVINFSSAQFNGSNISNGYPLTP